LGGLRGLVWFSVVAGESGEGLGGKCISLTAEQNLQDLEAIADGAKPVVGLDKANPSG
jgi:hypothetical protein